MTAWSLSFGSPIQELGSQKKKWEGTEISFANNGAEGLKKLQEASFDLVLMDLQMPVMDGYEACIAIRKGDAGIQNKNIPIIAVTADVMESTKQRVIKIGMDDYLAKPVHKDRLYVKMIRVLEGAAKLKQL